MALRISLILAILAGLGVIGVSQFVLKPQIEEIITARNTFKKNWEDTKVVLKNTQKTLEETKTKLTFTEKNLEETKGQLTAMTAKAESEEKRANKNQQDLTQTRQTLKAAQDKLEQWRQTGLEPEQVKTLVASEKQLKADKEVLSEESRMFQKEVKALKTRLDQLVGKIDEPPVPREATGKVVVVDPKWDFVVLNVGAGKGLPERGILLVSRNGELVAKVRVMSVQPERSVANVLPGWKIKDIMEGDTVIPY